VDDERAKHLRIQKAIEHLKQVVDMVDGEHHTWTILVQVHGGKVAWWRIERVYKPLEPAA
jgi:hypothetical protein